TCVCVPPGKLLKRKNNPPERSPSASIKYSQLVIITHNERERMSALLHGTEHSLSLLCRDWRPCNRSSQGVQHLFFPITENPFQGVPLAGCSSCHGDEPLLAGCRGTPLDQCFRC